MERIEMRVGTRRVVGAVMMVLLGLPFVMCGLSIPLAGEMQSMGWVLGAVFAAFGLVFIGTPVWLFRMWPTAIDVQGCTMRGGRRLFWSDLKDVKSIRTLRRGELIAWRVELKFRKGEARIDSITFDNAMAACMLIERVSKRPVVPSLR